MALTGRVWTAGKLLLLVAALAATYVFSAWLTTRVALKAREVRVPGLVGQPVASAGAILADLGLALKVDETRRADPKIGVGRIAQQDPPPGAVARRGRSVRVWVSTGNQAPPVPKLVGESERAARLMLHQDGLEVRIVSEIRSNDFPADVVIGQDPPPQSRAPGVSLLVNRGQAASAYVMPDLIGVNGYRVADALRAAGFRVAVVAQNPYPGVPAGVVIRQSPQGGFQVTPGFRMGVVSATMAIALVYLAALAATLFGIDALPLIHQTGLIGIGLSLFVVMIAALNLVMDFDLIESGARAGAPRYMEWYAAFGLIVTLIWLYWEVLKLLIQIAASSDDH